jgi:hypothetical protein
LTVRLDDAMAMGRPPLVYCRFDGTMDIVRAAGETDGSV